MTIYHKTPSLLGPSQALSFALPSFSSVLQWWKLDESLEIRLVQLSHYLYKSDAISLCTSIHVIVMWHHVTAIMMSCDAIIVMTAHFAISGLLRSCCARNMRWWLSLKLTRTWNRSSRFLRACEEKLPGLCTQINTHHYRPKVLHERPYLLISGLGTCHMFCIWWKDGLMCILVNDVMMM